jgi:hypothetical protein
VLYPVSVCGDLPKLNPVVEIMPDRCTPEFERTVAKMGSSHLSLPPFSNR